jgi:hypothetical protein
LLAFLSVISDFTSEHLFPNYFPNKTYLDDMVVISKRAKRIKLKWGVMIYWNGSNVKVADMC